MEYERVAPTASSDLASADPFLRQTDVIDWTASDVQVLARTLATGQTTAEDVARTCFEWVRDEIGHCVDYNRDEVTCSASEVLRVGTGFCYAKSHLLVALLRANGIRAGFCYQRLTANDDGDKFVVHGLAAVDLGEHGWYRIDPRGNKAGIDAQFVPPVEQLAYPTTVPGEMLFPKVYADPVPLVVRTLQMHDSARDLVGRLPDPVTEADLEA